MPLNNSKGIFLDVEPSILEHSLRFTTDPNEEELNKMFQNQIDRIPCKTIKPSPGFCIKTREIGNDKKFFINICYTDEIPPPINDLNEQQLLELLDNDNITDYRIPMSIGDVRIEYDKRNDEAKYCDIAINTKFYEKIETIQLFKNFFLTIVFEGLNNKHGIVCHDEKIILKNRKQFGTLQVHRIQNRDIQEKMKIQKQDNVEKKGLIEVIDNQCIEKQIKTPEYRLYRKRNDPSCMIGEFKFPDIISTKDLTLDIGEDRILIESKTKNYLLDIFIPYTIKQSSCLSTFDKATKVLTVTMPLVGG